ncbi:hypothetical protein H0H87_010392 [Tephrocybe sp. NHM501043]|nr:hypothetical protein H0H87_010392 [Tephrocybe sp. NHM501043]
MEAFRRLVSGNKARFKDEHLDLELDQVIIMGYPADGIEGWYRNRREDAKKFLEHRHGRDFWSERTRMKRAFLVVESADIRSLITTGKGRSGTMACTYLLSLDDDPSAPKLKRSYSDKEWAKLRAEDVMSCVPEDDSDDRPGPSSSGSNTPSFQGDTLDAAFPNPGSKSKKYHPDVLNTVLDLHTSRRMKRPSSPTKKTKQGVSIPSQRRWLYYWALSLSHTAPEHLWAVPPVPRPKVRLTQVKLRMRPPSTAKVGLVRAASVVLERAKGAKNTAEEGEAHVWISLARYDDQLIGTLEEWERRTRDEYGRMGVRQPGSEHIGEEGLRSIFEGDQWDKEKMVRTFARMGAVGTGSVVREKGENKDEKIDLYTLSPLTTQKWDSLRNTLETEDKPSLEDFDGPASETSSLYDATQSAKERGVILDAAREVRIKLYMGQVFMGWFWLVPTFHMAPVSEGPTKLRLTRKELDFPLGIGSAIVDIEIQMEWVSKIEAEVAQTPACLEQSEEVTGAAVTALLADAEIDQENRELNMSNIPLRRTTRIPRGTVKDNENANARPSRISTRTKVAATDAPIARKPALAPLAGKVKADNEKTAGKRKREALQEVIGVSNNHTKKVKEGGKGKEKEEAVTGEPARARVFGKPMMRPIPGATTNRSSRSATVSITSIQATADSSVAQPTRPTVFTSKPALKAIEEAGPDRAAKRRDTDVSEDRKVEDDSQLEADKIAEELVDLDEEVEAPNEEVKGWDDLDAGDWDDPAMVSEYVAEVCVYLKQIELQTRPNPDYMASHPELDWEKRGILVDWVLQVHARFNLLQETLFLFTNILDRFLSARPISLSKLQLVGITAFFIAAKYEETYAPSVAEIAYLADGQYTVEEILKAERYILKTLDYDLKYPGPMGWLRRGSKADNCDIQARTVGKYLIEIGCLEWRLVGTVPSLLAAAAMWLARLVLGREVWTPNMEHYMTYSEAELLPTANIILNYILKPIQHESLFKKYAHKRYLKASLPCCSAFMRHWALERWGESAVVDLAHELPMLKEEVVQERKTREAAETAAAVNET